MIKRFILDPNDLVTLPHHRRLSLSDLRNNSLYLISQRGNVLQSLTAIAVHDDFFFWVFLALDDSLIILLLINLRELVILHGRRTALTLPVISLGPCKQLFLNKGLLLLSKTAFLFFHLKTLLSEIWHWRGHNSFAKFAS
jgi:hypothetical protein